jgi:AcrR family transcriptional regulator
MSPEVGGQGGFRQEILDAIAGLLSQHTLDELRVTEILRTAKVARGTFYFYYASKEDAFAALLDQVYARVVPAFEQLFADAVSRRPPALAKSLANWLAFTGPETAVIRTAVEEWARHSGIREVHLAAQHRLAAAVRRALETDRRAGLAPPGPAPATLASALVWTMERAWYEALGAEPAELAAVTEALATTISAALYGAG